MDNIIYNSLNKYFHTLSVLGYKSYEEVYKLLTLILIEEFVNSDFYGLITKEDYQHIERALYCLFGTTCLIPYPSFCNNTNMNKLHLGSMTELATKIEDIQKTVDDFIGTIDTSFINRINDLEHTKVVKPGDDYIDIPDIVVS